SRTRLESECVPARVRLGRIAERRENGLAFVPVGKLIGVMATTRLPGLSCGEEQNRFIPISGVANKTHRGAMILRRRAYAVNGSRLGLVRDAEESLQQTIVSKGVEHIQGVEVLLRPFVNSTVLGRFVKVVQGKCSG